MKKKELMAMRSLQATPKMMNLAATDVLQRREVKQWGYTQVQETRTYDLFMRCFVENGILKLSLFSPTVMRLGDL